MINTLKTKLADAGFELTDVDLVLDREIHSFKTADRKGWYIGSQEETSEGQLYLTITIQDWLTDEKQTLSTSPKKCTQEEQSQIKKRNEAATREYEKAKRELQAVVSQRAGEAVRGFEQFKGVSRYFQKKGLKDITPISIKEAPIHGLKQRPNPSGLDLIIPMKDVKGQVWGYQSISDDGSKCFLDGQKIEGCFFQVGTFKPDSCIYICEGFATGLTVRACTKQATVVIAFNSRNLEHVAKSFRQEFPELAIVIVADNDMWKIDSKGRQWNTGLHGARKACREVRGSYIVPEFFEKWRADQPTDFNDLFCILEKHQDFLGYKEIGEQFSSHYIVYPHEFIETEMDGFNKWVEKADGKGQKQVIAYQNLRAYLTRHHHTKVLGESKMVFSWVGTHYEEIGKTFLENFAQEHFRDSSGELTDNKIAGEFRGLVMRSSVVCTEWFDSTTRGRMNFTNGVLDYSTGKFKPHTPARGFRSCLTYAYDPDAKCPTFDQMMKDITCQDNGLEQMLLEFAGLGMSNTFDKTLDACLVLKGSGSNGKSTLMNVFRALVGKANYSVVTIGDLANPNSRQMLDGKLFNICDENDSKAIDSNIFKNLVTEGETTGNKKYKDIYQFVNRAKFIFAFNEFDRAFDMTEGFYRRLRIAPFNARFTDSGGNRDANIEEKLLKELPGIFNRVRAAYFVAKKRGHIIYAEAAKKELEDLKYESDHVRQFFDECIVIPESEEIFKQVTKVKWATFDGSGAYVAMPKLLQEYTKWALENNYKPIGRETFSKRIVGLLGEHLKEKRAKGEHLGEHFGEIKLKGPKIARVRSLLGVTFRSSFDV